MRVGAGDRVVDDVDALVGTHLQRLAHRVDGLLGADAQRGHLDVLALAGLLLDLQRLLDGVLVELGQQAVDADAVDGVVGLELRSAVASGTYFTQTTMFMVVWPRGPSCAARCVVVRLLASHVAVGTRQRSVGSARSRAQGRIDAVQDPADDQPRRPRRDPS